MTVKGELMLCHCTQEESYFLIYLIYEHPCGTVKEIYSVSDLTGFPTCWGVNSLIGQSRGQERSLGLPRVSKVVQNP